jgi:hypothetical protein
MPIGNDEIKVMDLTRSLPTSDSNTSRVIDEFYESNNDSNVNRPIFNLHSNESSVSASYEDQFYEEDRIAREETENNEVLDNYIFLTVAKYNPIYVK